MKALLKKRQGMFLEKCFKYSRYVFNDHFVLFLLIFLAFLAVQYSQLLRNFPKDSLPIIMVLLGVSVFILPIGTIATYLEKADKHFLLTKEEELLHWLKQSSYRSFLVWGSLQTVLLLILMPLFLGVGIPSWGFLLYLALMLFGKYAFFQYKLKKLIGKDGLNWDLVIQVESQRQQAVLRFFALFTNVKGIHNSVKRRAYLDSLLGLIPKQQDKTWTNLYFRSFLRNGELFGLSFRLLALSIFFIVFIGNSLLATVLSLLFQYLMLFQLTALYQAFDYQYLTLLFPLDIKLKKAGVRQVIQGISGVSLFLQTIIALFFFQEKIWLLLLLVVSCLLIFVYLPFRLRRLVDE